MENPTSSIKNTLKLSWLSFLEALYSLSPFQRLLAIGAVVYLIPMIQATFEQPSTLRSGLNLPPSYISSQEPRCRW
jgi:hypothetical protein